MTVVLRPPPLQFRFLPINFSHRTFHIHQHQVLQQPLFASVVTAATTTSSSFSVATASSDNPLLSVQNLSLQNEEGNNLYYDFAPLLEFLSTYSPSSDDIQSSSPAQLEPSELQLAELYGAVPAQRWHSLLKSLASTPASISTAYALVTWLQKHNLCFSYELLYSILIHALGRSEKLYEAFLLSQRQTLTPLTYNALIGACARNGDLEKALNLMAKMRQDGYPSDFVNYSLVIQSLMRNNSIDSALLEKLYGEIEADMFELDSQLMNDITVGFAKSGNLNRALSFLSMMQGNGLSPKVATLVAIISELGKSGRTEEAEAVFEELKEGGLKPRTRAYNALLKGYVKTGALKDAEDIVSEMERRGVAPDEYTYGLLIDAYGNAGRWESARIVLKEMEANNVEPNSYIFSRILASYRDRGEWQRSFQVLKEMKNNGISPNRQFYNVMIDTFGKYNCLDHAMDTFERMKHEGIEPDTVTWNTIIDCHRKHGHHNKAEMLFEKMQESGCLPCTATYNIMINSFGEQERWDGVKDLLSKMQSQGLLPNVVTYTTLVDIYGHSGRFNEAIECLEVMKSAGLKPPSTMYNALINAYARRVCLFSCPNNYYFFMCIFVIN